MKITILETSKLLKEAGFPQENCEFYYFNHFSDEFIVRRKENMTHVLTDQFKHLAFAAPTAEEVLDELPEIISSEPNELVGTGKTYLTIQKLGYYEVGYTLTNGDMLFDSVEDKSLSEALAKMYLYLAEKGLLK